MASTAPPKAPLPVKAVVSLVAGNCLAVTSAPLAPLIVGALVRDLAFGEATAAMMITVEFLAISTASLAIAPFAGRVNRRLTAMLAALTIIAGSLASALAHSVTWLTPARIVTGLGEGALVAAISAAAAGAPNPQRTFALLGLSISIYAMVLLLVAPSQVRLFGAAGLFTTIAMVGLLVLPLLAHLPARIAPGLSTRRGRLPADSLRFACLGLGAMVVLAAGQSSIGAFLERIGSALSMSSQGIGNVLAASALVSLAGPAAAHSLGDRLGHSLPFVAGGVVLVAASLTLGHTGAQLPYTIAAMGAMAGLLFLMPYVMGMFAALDAGGRLAAAAPAFGTLGHALGSALGAGMLSLGFAYRGVAWLSVASYGIAITMLLVIVREAARGGNATSVEPALALMSSRTRDPSPHDAASTNPASSRSIMQGDCGT